MPDCSARPQCRENPPVRDSVSERPRRSARLPKNNSRKRVVVSRRGSMSALSLTLRDGGEATFSIDRLAQFRSRVRGPVLVAGDQQYEEARQIWNGAHHARPALIARCTGVADVIESVNFARGRRASRRSRRRAQRCRHFDVRRRYGDRPVVDEGNPRRPSGRACLGAGGRYLGRSRSGNTGVLVDDSRRQHLLDRHRRLDPRRRHGLVPPGVRHERR